MAQVQAQGRKYGVMKRAFDAIPESYRTAIDSVQTVKDSLEERHSFAHPNVVRAHGTRTYFTDNFGRFLNSWAKDGVPFLDRLTQVRDNRGQRRGMLLFPE